MNMFNYISFGYTKYTILITRGVKMYISSVSFSYFLLGISIISLAFSIYFKTLVIKTSPDNPARTKIIGDMKDPISWRNRNSIAGNLSITWCLLSLLLFIFFKFMFVYSTIYIYYTFIYIALIAISLFFIKIKDKQSI